MRLKGKSALVTAAGQGIGRAAVLAMAAEGAQVLATDVKPQLLSTFSGVANVRTEVLDVLDRAAIERTIGGMSSNFTRVRRSRPSSAMNRPSVAYSLDVCRGS